MKRRKRSTTRTVTLWETCRVCANQMVGGERCLVHNPTPELRELLNTLTVLSVVIPRTCADSGGVSRGTVGDFAGVQ